MRDNHQKIVCLLCRDIIGNIEVSPEQLTCGSISGLEIEIY
jgi:hypothetical protein